MRPWIRSKGTVALVALATYAMATLSCGSAGSSPKNTYVYVAETQSVGSSVAATVAQFRVQPDGTLSALIPATVPINTGYTGLAVDPSGRHLFANGSDSFAEFTIGSDGTIQPNPVPTIEPGTDPGGMAFTPDGQYAIVADVNGAVESYRVDVNGAMTLVDTLPSTGAPASVAVAPSGSFAYVTLFDDDMVSAFGLSPSGALTSGPSAATDGYNPMAIAISPQGFVYCGNANSGTVAAFATNSSSGALTALNSYSAAGDLIAIALDPTGTYAYVIHNNVVSQFMIDATTGALSPNGPDVSSVQYPARLVVDPSGKFAFVAAYSGTVSQFTIDSNGRLNPNGVVPLGTYSAAESIALVRR